jgi:HEAT repeat protein
VKPALEHLGREYGVTTLLRLASHPEARVREAVAISLAGHEAEAPLAALIALSRDEASEVRDWATFALGSLQPQDTPELRDALAERIGDEDPQTRLEAVHGLAIRGDRRAVEPALELLAAAAADDDDDDGLWRRVELRETAQRLAAVTGDERFAPYLPG